MKTGRGDGRHEGLKEEKQHWDQLGPWATKQTGMGQFLVLLGHRLALVFTWSEMGQQGLTYVFKRPLGLLVKEQSKGLRET